MVANSPPPETRRSSGAESLRLGIDGESLRTPLSGIGRYVLRLCTELERQLPQDAQLFAYSRLPKGRLALPSDRWTLRVESSRALRRLPSFLWLKTRGAELCARDRLHVFWGSRTLLPHLPAPVRTVSTVHDLNHLLVPETMQMPTLWSHRLWFHGDLLHARHVVANSGGTAERLRSLLMRDVDDVVTPGIDAEFAPPPPHEAEGKRGELKARGVRAPYILSVSTLEPRKNLVVLLDAFVGLKQRGELDGYNLVLVGTSGWKNRDLERALERAAVHGVVLTGYMPNELLPALYANAELFALPSLYEGFGMPVLEARACGTRVLASDTPELRAVAGPHAILVEPNLVGVRDGIRLALSRPRVNEPGLAQEYSWSRSAARLARLFEDASSTEGGHRDEQYGRTDDFRNHLHA